ncbi:MAG: DUF72 domain-containing protein [Gemmatimonadota bacterium]
MKLRAGTSGYSYKEWRGSFYPEALPQREMLAHYSSRLPAVEINNTFYRLPRREVLERWADQVPDRFRFVLKASRRITHFKRLSGAEEETAYLLETIAAGLGGKAGGVLFQLPPTFEKDVDRLERFLAALPAAGRTAFEFRHPSWFDDELLRCLDRHGATLCVAETEEAPPPALFGAGGWGYVRLRKPAYSDAELRAWVGRIREQAWEEAYVFFKHEEEATGPAAAARFLELAVE